MLVLRPPETQLSTRSLSRSLTWPLSHGPVLKELVKASTVHEIYQSLGLHPFLRGLLESWVEADTENGRFSPVISDFNSYQPVWSGKVASIANNLLHLETRREDSEFLQIQLILVMFMDKNSLNFLVCHTDSNPATREVGCGGWSPP